ncbi:putative PH domain-containing protein [Golovinomyces cichoracearum]|uniref:Putative PH domain-containing protein n=1 Tax=Golovinomyces cichoracearum TaxID=62708 RepID=A0A420IEI9_9PEZI|nr:putative PH domain-containing protein [Golovinomyces cichoracearum]
MGSLYGYLLMYMIGCFSFPLFLIATLFIHAYLVLPSHKCAVHRQFKESLTLPSDDVDLINRSRKSVDEKLQSRDCDDSEVAAGYFAVSRDYIPGGINGRPPERITPMGSTPVSAPIQNVYKSVYRSIFERKPAGILTEKSSSKPQKKGNNVFYIVLRHGHLMLFDDEEQFEVRHVVSLEHYDVSIYSGGDEIPEGELFIKRNAICLSRRKDLTEGVPDGQISKPFYLFSDNCSDKEDFYLAILHNQEKQPKPLQYDFKDIITLVQKLHSSEEHVNTRWINAIIGRIFLALYKTSEVENFFRSKIKKKISRVKTPSFLSKIVLQNIDMGESAPIITNPKLKELTVNGELIVEADLRYSGNFRIEVATTARIDLGTRFKAREVNLVLAVNLKRIEGHFLLKIKPPPSNRFWMCFQTQPKIDMTIEPIVSSRQITYTLILRQIENRIKEVVAESLVFPHWDDSPFFGTENKIIRGGIWAKSCDYEKVQSENHKTADLEARPPERYTDAASNNDEDDIPRVESEEPTLFINEADMSSKTTSTCSSNSFNRRKRSSVLSLTSHESYESLVKVENSLNTNPKSQNPLRSGSFPSSSSPIVRTDNTTADAFKNTPNSDHSHTSTAFSALSQMSSSLNSSSGSSPPILRSEKSELRHVKNNIADSYDLQGTISLNNVSSSSKSEKSETNTSINNIERSRRHHSTSSFGNSSTTEIKRISLVTMTNAAATAKKWGWGALQRSTDQKNENKPENISSSPLVMGRGQPLPPPGIPLPPPSRKSKMATIPAPKRKILPPPEITERSEDKKLASSTVTSYQKSPPLPPLFAGKRGPETSKAVNKRESNCLLIFPAPSVDSDEACIEDTDSLSVDMRNTPRKKESIDQMFLGSIEDEDQIIPSWIATPERDETVRSGFLGE